MYVPIKRRCEPPQDFPDREILMDSEQVAAVLGVSIKTVRRMRKDGRLPPFKRIGRLYRWRKADILDYLESL
ncbi:helix-turn-helix domain-containing protein [Bremerella sp. P1]|uniref:helix-turn-helix domain-containing protein n=1 Tax=Bremerella sp. P1 TaxID=3026424 RepID=UPI002367BF0C|nr:helix-turn-helix domain-containing protein [Bremerella sp. P1]WDI43367.1 helix-turn-helix domain-containing protein [Bremerella sp. P1]